MCSAEVPIRMSVSCPERSSGAGPAKWLGKDVIEIVDELLDTFAQITE
jgi:hypothetical protein